VLAGRSEGMRDLLFKNLTSPDKKKRRISVIEVTQDKIFKTEIRRHFVCLIREIKEKNPLRPSPYLYVLKRQNTKEKIENFFCRLKGSVYAVSNDRLYLIVFCHSLKISLIGLSEAIKV
jgi:hypothetical protein